MADNEVDLNNLAENDELFDDMKDVVDGEGGEDDDHEDELEQFLNENKLQEHLSLFRDQQIDFETLMILTETDLKSLGLPLGPFRKLIIALQKKKGGKADDSVSSNADVKVKDESDLPPLADEGNFRVIDESGDDSDTHSVKSEHAGGKKKDDSKAVEPDKNHPYIYDLLHFQLPEEFKIKVELEEQPTTVDAKTCESVSDERRLRGAIRALRKEKIVAVAAKHVDTYVKKMTVMQISTPNVDYLIDFNKMNHMILSLTDIFSNPNILKVFYDAKHEVKFLQKHFNLFTINAYCVRSAAKELNYETTSLHSQITKFCADYFRPSDSECAQTAPRNDVKLNLRRETHYLLHLYNKTRNEAIEKGVLDKVLSVGARLCGYLHVPLKDRKPETIFTDYDKFNDAQKLAAEELHNWRETVAQDKNCDPNTVISVANLKALCLSLPIKKDELLAVADTRIVRIYFTKLLAILKTARKKYFNDPKDDSKYVLKAIEPKAAVAKKPAAATSPKGAGGAARPRAKPVGKASSVGGASNSGKPDLKRKNDGFAHPSAANKKPRFRGGKKNFNLPKRNSFDKTNKSPKGSPFRSSGGYRGGYQGNSQNSVKNFQQNMNKYQSPQNIWEPQQNQNFNSSYGGGGFKYY